MIRRRYAWYILSLLAAINFFNYVDRLVIVTMYTDLRAKFGFTDPQLGSFWFAFFVVHGLATFPLGWASDHFDRRKIIGIGVIVWSLATLGSAWAIGFWSLFFLRGVVGIGEAAYNPPSNALLCEVFPEQKSRAVAIYNGGMFGGACAGLAAGGLLGFPSAFQVVAVPGLILGTMALFMKVPPERVMISGKPRLAAMFTDGWRTMRVPTMKWIVLSGIFISCAAGGYISWIVEFTLRYKNLTVAAASKIYTVIVMTAGVSGALLGGLLGDAWHRRSPRGRPLTIAIGFLLAVPFTLLILVIDIGFPFFVCGWFLLFFLSFYNGPIAAAIDDVVDDRDAGTAQATYVVIIHLVGTGPGGFLVGAVSSFTGLRLAMLVPAAAILLSGFCAYMASLKIAGDIAARGARLARLALAGPVAQAAAGG